MTNCIGLMGKIFGHKSIKLFISLELISHGRKEKFYFQHKSKADLDKLLDFIFKWPREGLYLNSFREIKMCKRCGKITA